MRRDIGPDSEWLLVRKFADTLRKLEFTAVAERVTAPAIERTQPSTVTLKDIGTSLPSNSLHSSATKHSVRRELHASTDRTANSGALFPVDVAREQPVDLPDHRWAKPVPRHHEQSQGCPKSPC